MELIMQFSVYQLFTSYAKADNILVFVVKVKELWSSNMSSAVFIFLQ